MNSKELKSYWDLVYQGALDAYQRGEVPVSAGLLLPDGTFLQEENRVEERNDPFAHAEFLVIKKGLEVSQSRYLKGSTLFVTLEPCLLCMGAILKANVSNLYYGLDDPKAGALSYHHVYVDNVLSVHQIEDKRLSTLIDDFFHHLREKQEIC